jgi:hypothetical protein
MVWKRSQSRRDGGATEIEPAHFWNRPDCFSKLIY